MPRRDYLLPCLLLGSPRQAGCLDITCGLQCEQRAILTFGDTASPYLLPAPSYFTSHFSFIKLHTHFYDYT